MHNLINHALTAGVAPRGERTGEKKDESTHVANVDTACVLAANAEAAMRSDGVLSTPVSIDLLHQLVAVEEIGAYEKPVR